MRQGRQGQPALDAVLSGMSIHVLDSRLTLTDAQEVPSWETPVSGRAVPHGQFSSGLRRRQLEIRLTVHLKAWDAGERGRLYQALCRQGRGRSRFPGGRARSCRWTAGMWKGCRL